MILNEGNGGTSLIDLPNVELFVFFQALVNLTWLKALSSAYFSYFGKFNSLATPG
jgi:hypothetical protein